MVRKQDDFYEAINGKWAVQAEIPADKVRTGGFNDLSDEIEELMLQTTDQWLAGENVPDDAILNNFIKLHHLTSDQTARQQVGVQPVQNILQKIESLTSFSDYVNHLVDFEKQGYPNALPLGVAPDFKNAQLNVLWADALGTILPDTTYYAADHPKKQELLDVYRKTTREILAQFGYQTGEIDYLLNQTLAYDAKIARYVLSNEEGSEYAKLYHPYAWQDFTSLVPQLHLNQFMNGVIGTQPDQIIVPEERFWQHAQEFYSEEAWPELKAYLIVETALSYTGWLTDDLRVLGGAYGRYVSGTPEAVTAKKAAYYLAAGPFNQALGLWYAHQNFPAVAKADVEHKVQVMIDVYQHRLEENTWLQPTTKTAAIEKLSAIDTKIGYPETLPKRYQAKVIHPQKGLFKNLMMLTRQNIAEAWLKWNQPVDRTEWHMPAHMVNAYYDPQQNQIVFPAAILQAPFYSLEQSSSANYGGIGAVIAHEISHAFDTNGASFDASGSLHDWWRPEDYAAFEKRTQAVVNQFDGLDSYGVPVNGKLTVSENVADLGGLAAALAAAQQDADFSAESFFINWATIWRMKARKEYMQMMTSIDVHGPAKLRVNVQVANFDLFFETFGVEPGDQMWRDPKDRIMIW
ncbi:M13-type metalloendopeptidase [Weissella kandleri]|uniref:M13-type metalloendopeptidase n=1 Tax=Weissella kandleri TaxID=1616 RepID=UPI00387EB3DC